MKKIFTLVAAAMMAFTINAQSDISFGIYAYEGSMMSPMATSGPVTGMRGYVEKGAASYQVTNDGNETYTIKNFLGGSDYSFTITDEEKGASLNGPNNPVTGNQVTVTEVGTYTPPTDYTIFSEDGHESLRFKNLTFGSHSNSKFSLDGVYILLRRNVTWNNTFETSTNGSSWTAMPNSNSIVIAAIIPVIKKNGGSSAIDEINANDENAPVEYYNLQGMRINEPAAGQIVIRRQGSKVSKIVF